MNPIWLVRAKRWVQNPPSVQKIKFVFAIIAVCAVLYLLERYVGLPDWMSAERIRRPRIN